MSTGELWAVLGVYGAISIGSLAAVVAVLLHSLGAIEQRLGRVEQRLDTLVDLRNADHDALVVLQQRVSALEGAA